MLLYYITDRHAFPGTEAEKRVRLLAKIAEAAQCGVDFIQLREKDLTPRELERLAREAMQVVRDHTPLESPVLATGHSPLPTRLLINSRTDIALAVGADGVHLTSNDIATSDAREVVARCSGPSSLTPNPFLVAVSCRTTDEVRRAEAQGADFAVFAPVFEKSVVIRPQTEAGVPHPSHEARGWASRKSVSQKSRDEGLAALKRAVGNSVSWEGRDFSCVANRGRIGAPSQTAEKPSSREGHDFSRAANCRPINAVLAAEVSPSGPQQSVVSAIPVLALGGITLDDAHDCIAAGAAGIAAIRLFQENDIAQAVRRLRPHGRQSLGGNLSIPFD